MLEGIQSFGQGGYLAIELGFESKHQVVLALEVLTHELDLLLHGALLVLEVSDAVVVVFVLPFEASLAPSTVNVVLIALGINMDGEGLPRELLRAVRAGHHSLLTIEQVLPQDGSWKLLVAVHALGARELALLPDMLL